MSSKKASTKETKTAAKKPAAKPAAKAAAKPAKAAEKKPAAKAKAPEKKPAAKTATASAAKKPAPKAAAKETKVTAKETKVTAKAKPAAKPAAKAPAKPAPKAAAKPAPKAAAKAKPVVKAAPEVKPAKAKAPAKEVEVRVSKAKAPAKVVEQPVEKASKAKAKKVEPVVETEKVKPASVEPSPKGKKSGDEVKAKDEPKKTNEYDYAVLLEGVKKLSKSIMFVEVDEQEDRSNKKKMSSEMKNLEMKPTASIRRKSSLAEETQEELTERILKELEEQNLAFEREAATQMCTRCNRNLVSPEFWVDKHLGYCEECAMILKLGQSKEARKVEYQLGAMGGDSLDEEDDEILGPDADDLKEAEEDLADMDD